MKKLILILFLAMSLSFNSNNNKEKPRKYIKVSDKLDLYRLRDKKNIVEFDKKVHVLLIENN